MNQEHKIQVLIVGATGQLGLAITAYALNNPNLHVSVLTRMPPENPDLIPLVESRGGKVIFGDLADPESLIDVTKHIHTVISAVYSHDEKVMVDGQKALVEDCLKNGVKRFIPSEYGLDTKKFHRDELIFSHEYAMKLKFEDYLRTVNIPVLRFHVGIFTHTLFEILQRMQCYYGETELKHNVTTLQNTARLIVAGAATAELTGDVYYSGGDYTILEIEQIYNKVRGTYLELKRAGYIGDLRSEYLERKKVEGESDYVKLLGSLLIFYDGRSKFKQEDNDAFPDVEPTTLEQFLEDNPEVKLELLSIEPSY